MKRIGLLLFIMLFIMVLMSSVAFCADEGEMEFYANGQLCEIDYSTQTIAVPQGTDYLIIKRGVNNSGYDGEGTFPAILVTVVDEIKYGIVCDEEDAVSFFKKRVKAQNWENAQYNPETKEFTIPISGIGFESEADGIRVMDLIDSEGSGFPLRVKEVQTSPDYYTVTINGSAKDDINAQDKATAGIDFVFTVNEQDGYSYSVPEIVIGGYAYTGFLVDENTYTIPGSAITGNIVITVIKEAIPVHTHTPGAVVKENEFAATCTEAGSYDEVVYCTECGEEITRDTKTIEALGHDWDEGKVTQEATVDEEGVLTKTCKRCGETETEAIPKLTPSENVANIINALPTEVTIDNKDDIVAARSAYEALTEAEKESFPELSLAKLELAEAKLATAQAEADQKAAEEATAQAEIDKKAAEEAAAQAEADKKAAEEAAAQAEADKKAAEEAAAQSEADKKAAEEAAAKAEADKKAAEEAAAQAEADKKAAEEAAAKAEADKKAADEALAQAEADKKAAEDALAETQAKLEAAQKEAEAAKLAQQKAEAKNYTVKGFKVTVKNRKFTVKYKKNTKASGYQIQYKLKTAKKYTTLKKTAKLKVTSKKLKKGKTYQFRVRTYTNIDGKKVYGQWSAVKSVKCK